MKVFVTGATGNIGREVVHFLLQNFSQIQVTAGVRNPQKSEAQFSEWQKVRFELFDFENAASYSSVNGNDVLFLLRPPQISDVNKVFKPFLKKVHEHGIQKVVFLSVQGVEKSSIIPHHKIEKLIVEEGFQYVFLRPGYFMQNITTTLFDDIKSKRTIVLPSGNAVFNWIDIKNIGEVAAEAIGNFNSYQNTAFDITGNENLSFPEVVKIANHVISKPLFYKSKNPLRYFFYELKKGTPAAFVMVKLMLHFLPRFQSPPPISATVKILTGKEPTTLNEFFEREKTFFD